MNPESVIGLAEQAVYATLMIVGPTLLLALGVGLLVSVFQATTQIQEQTLAFIPKIIAVLLSLVLFGPWMLRILLDFTLTLYQNINQFSG